VIVEATVKLHQIKQTDNGSLKYVSKYVNNLVIQKSILDKLRQNIEGEKYLEVLH
jgi:hypothetical protein